MSKITGGTSPWGRVQYGTCYERGVRSVSTAGHGGFMIAQVWAKKHLPEATIKRGSRWSGYICYEEDCDWAIVVLQLPQHWEEILQYASEEIRKAPRAYIIRVLSSWTADYLLELGISPVEPEYSQYKARELDQKMRDEEHPDLIVSAVGDWHEDVPAGCVGVDTADGKWHIVTGESYEHRAGLQRVPNLLSMCELVKAS